MFLVNVRHILTLSSFSSSYIYLDPPNTTKKLLKVLLHYGFFASAKGSQPSAHRSAPARARCSSARYTARAHRPGSAAGGDLPENMGCPVSPSSPGTFGAPKYGKIWQNQLFTQFTPPCGCHLAMIWSKPANNGWFDIVNPGEFSDFWIWKRGISEMGIGWEITGVPCGFQGLKMMGSTLRKILGPFWRIYLESWSLWGTNGSSCLG